MFPDAGYELVPYRHEDCSPICADSCSAPPSPHPPGCLYRCGFSGPVPILTVSLGLHPTVLITKAGAHPAILKEKCLWRIFLDFYRWPLGKGLDMNKGIKAAPMLLPSHKGKGRPGGAAGPPGQKRSCVCCFLVAFSSKQSVHQSGICWGGVFCYPSTVIYTTSPRVVWPWR